MTSRDFCYWLQGLFELSENLTCLSAKQVSLIQKHLALVFRSQVDASRNADANVGARFCSWLEGFLEDKDKEPLEAASVSKIRERLNNQFLHAIDPTFQNRDELSEIHSGRKPKDNEPPYEVMC